MSQWCYSKSNQLSGILPYVLPSCFLLSFNFFLSSFYSVVIISFFLCAAFIASSHCLFVLFNYHSFSSFLHSTVILSLFYSWFYSVVILSFLLLPFFLFYSVVILFAISFFPPSCIFFILVKVRTTQVAAW